MKIFIEPILPEKKNGILSRLRMFRNFGSLKISSDRLLHFPATPYKRNRLNAPILIRHYGNIKAETREMKYKRYTEQDKEGLIQGYNYDYLLETNVALEDLENVKCNWFGNEVNWFV